MFPRRRKPSPARAAAASLLEAARSAARSPALFGPGRIPDTLDGRFESMVLHVVLLLERLRQDGEGEKDVGQALFDAMFADFDAAIRELGAEDIGVAKRIRRMAEAFYGRQRAYREALDSEDDAALAAAIERNLLATADAPAPFVAAMTAYVRSSWRRLSAQSIAGLTGGETPRWGVLPA